MREENRRLSFQPSLQNPTRATIVATTADLSIFKNESEHCNEQDFSVLVFSENARDGNNEEAIVTRGISSVRDSRTTSEPNITNYRFLLEETI